MKARAFILAAVLLCVLGSRAITQESAGPDAQPESTLALDVTLQLIASDPERTSRSVTEWADAVGGYFTYRSDEQVLIRIPPDRVPELRRRIEELDDTVVSYNPSAIDYREEIARNQAAINSRTESLDRILVYLDEADIAATLSFERELRSLLREIELYTGQLRRIRNDVSFASATINLSSRQRTIPAQRPSTFEWINTVDLYRFLGEARP
jgi:uncharacterized protein DUF4349